MLSQQTTPKAARRAEQTVTVHRAFLVYQAGLANVFAVDCANLADFGRNARRLMQGDFRSCENFARGLAAAGVLVHTAACNMAGDITHQPWTDDLDAQPFSEKFAPVSQVKTVGASAMREAIEEILENAVKYNSCEKRVTNYALNLAAKILA